jgi:MFS transporter, ACS family, hexuronate transporter
MQIKKTRWWLVVLMFLTSTLGYMDRSAIGIAAPMIAKDLHLSSSQMGLVFSAFFVGYVLFAIVGGRAADIWGPKRIIVVSLGVWSLFCGMTAFADGLVFMLLVRIMFGVGEGPFPPAQNKLVGHWFPRKEQATVIGLFGSGEAIGGALSGPIVGLVAVSLSWRFSFGLIALLGALLMLVWLFAATDWPEDHPRVGMPERALIKTSRASESVATASSGSLLATCFSRDVLATALAWFGYAYVLFFFLSWFPSFLASQYHMSIKNTGLISSLPWLCGFIGRFSGGMLSDALFRRLGNALLARKLVVGGGLLVAAAGIALAGTVTDVVSAVLLTSVSVFAIALTANGYWALILDVVPADKVGGAGGFGLGAGSLAGVIAPTATGFILERTGSYVSAFVLAGIVASVGALAVLLLIRHKRTAGVGLSAEFR